jgi:hypothetical protein
VEGLEKHIIAIFICKLKLWDIALNSVTEDMTRYILMVLLVFLNKFQFILIFKFLSTCVVESSFYSLNDLNNKNIFYFNQ